MDIMYAIVKTIRNYLNYQQEYMNFRVIFLPQAPVVKMFSFHLLPSLYILYINLPVTKQHAFETTNGWMDGWLAILRPFQQISDI